MTAQEEGKELQRLIHNISRNQMKEIGEAMTRIHPTIQQNFMCLFMNFADAMAKNRFVDDRNQASVNLAKEIMDIPLKKRILPFI